MMKELNELIIARMNNMTESGAIQQLIDTQLQESVKDILKNSLRSYSDFGKAVTEKLEASLSGAVSKVSFPEYSHFISAAVVDCVSAHMNEHVVAGIQEQIKEVLQPVPKEITGEKFLSELSCFFDSDSAGVEFEDGPYILPEWDISSDETAVYMKVEGQFKVSFYDHKKNGSWYIGYIEDDRERHITADLGGATHTYGVIGYLYKLYCTGTIFTGIDRCCNHDAIISIQ